MLKQLVHRRQSVAWTWLISYLAVLLLPLCISLFVTTVSSQTLREEIHTGNAALLSQLRQVMDGHLRVMEQLNMELTLNVRVRELLYSNKYEARPDDYPYDIYMVSETMKSFRTVYSAVDSFYTYLNDTQTIIAPGLVREEALAFRLLHDSEALGFEAWRTLLADGQKEGFVSLNRGTEAHPHYFIAFLSRYPADNLDASPASNLVMVDEHRIWNTIAHVKLFKDGYVYILDSNKQVLIANTPYRPRFDDENLAPVFTGQDVYYTDQEGRQYEVLQIASGTGGLSYVSMVPRDLYWERAEMVRNLTLSGMLISLIGGGLLTTFFIRRNYHPLRSLVRRMKSKSNITGSTDNEFQFLGRMLDRTLEEMESLQTKLSQQNQALRNNFLLRLLKGRQDPHIPLDEASAAFNMRIVSERYAVILIYLQQASPFFERLEHMQQAEKMKLLTFVVTNIMEEIVSDKHAGYVIEADDSLVCLVNLSETIERGGEQAELARICKETQVFLSEHYKIELTFAISGVHQGVENIYQGYTDALDAMSYKVVMGANEIIAYEQIDQQVSGTGELGFYYPLAVEQQLINFLKAGDYEQTMELLKVIMEENSKNPPAAPAIARCFMLNVVSTVIKAVNELGDGGGSELLTQTHASIEKLAACDTLQEMHQLLKECLRDFCGYTASLRHQKLTHARQEALDKLVEEVRTFVNQQYADPNMNITLIGNHFDMKPAYLSKLFKEQTGQGLLDLINSLRIVHAKKLILETNAPLGEIAATVGYSDANSFIRVFKKYEGITPGKYKEIVVPPK